MNLELEEGISTKKFLNLCELNSGKLLSVDIDDCSNLFSDKNWTFIKTRDDNIDKIKNHLHEPLDIILIDSLHEPKHVKKLVFMYWKYLKIGGSMYIDDISWLPYIRGNWRDHEYTEKINYDTFNEILKILANNFDNFNLDFSFIDSGMARLSKLNNEPLCESNEYKLRNNFIKNSLKNVKFFKKT